MTNSTQPIPSFRVGMGYDVHKLVEGRDLYLGGIKIEHSLGLLGHSDADVLIHAICDALLGAANMRDIGYHFPDTSADTLDMDSKIILRKTIDLLATKGYRVGNIDATVCAERPKINPHIPAWLTLSVATSMPYLSRPPLPSAWASLGAKRAWLPTLYALL